MTSLRLQTAGRLEPWKCCVSVCHQLWKQLTSCRQVFRAHVNSFISHACDGAGCYKIQRPHIHVFKSNAKNCWDETTVEELISKTDVSNCEISPVHWCCKSELCTGMCEPNVRRDGTLKLAPRCDKCINKRERYVEQDKQCTCNVTLRRVRVTIVTVEEQ
jgi:hypothetical protein